MSQIYPELQAAIETSKKFMEKNKIGGVKELISAKRVGLSKFFGAPRVRVIFRVGTERYFFVSIKMHALDGLQVTCAKYMQYDDDAN